MFLIDTHTHLYADEFDTDRQQVVQQALDAGIEYLFLPNIDRSTTQSMFDLVAQFPNNCFPMMGLHPTSVKEDFRSELQHVEAVLEKQKVIAIGEIGIDLYWDKTFVEEQKLAFRYQIELSKKYRLPIVIHARDSFDEIFAIVDELNDDNLKGVFHSFTGTLQQAQHIIDYGGFMIGINGIVTFKNAGLDKTVAAIPLKHLVLETDSPYLAPTPKRGKRNESAFLIYTAKKIAELHHISLDELAEITKQNALEIFKL